MHILQLRPVLQNWSGLALVKSDQVLCDTSWYWIANQQRFYLMVTNILTLASCGNNRALLTSQFFTHSSQQLPQSLFVTDLRTNKYSLVALR